MARRSLTAANVLAVIFLAAQAGGAAARRGRATLGLVFLAAAAQGASAQKDACATGAEGRWAGTHARLLALDESKLPNLYQRKLEFENITGASIDIEQKSIKDWAGSVFSDAKTARLYDGYVLKGSWVPELAEIGAIRDVSEYAAAEDRWGSLAWNDIAPIVQQFCAYDQKLYAVPLDADYMVFVAREDLEGSDAIATLDDFAAFAERWDGHDLNGDGEPDAGVCFAKGPDSSHFSVMGVLGAIAAPHLQKSGTTSGVFFDTETLDPNTQLPGFADALDVYKRLLAASAGGPETPVVALQTKKDFAGGKCAAWISLPGFVFGVENGGGGNVLRLKAPGVECASLDDCPFAEVSPRGTLVSSAPYFATSGIALSVTTTASDAAADMLFDFYTYAAAQDQANIDVMNPGSFSDPFRESQLGAAAASLLVETKGWERARAARYLNTTMWGHNHGNGALDLRVPGSNTYAAALLAAVQPYVHYGEGTAAGAASAATDAWRAVPQQVFEGSDADAARARMLEIYRANLGLPPIEQFVSCAPGSYAPRPGLDATCALCPPGRYTAEAGATTCSLCRSDEYQQSPGATRCEPCPAHSRRRPDADELFADGVEKVQCLCDEGYYKKPDGSCGRCQDDGAICPVGTTLATIGHESGYWRASTDVSRIYECPLKKRACPEGIEANECEDGYVGAACGACKSNYYLKKPKNRCKKCDAGDVALFWGVLVAIAVVVIAVVAVVACRRANERESIDVKAALVSTSWSSVARWKLLWVVGQVIVSINDTLQINWPAPFRGLVDALAFFQFDLALLPVDCVMDYSVYARLYMATLIPIGLVALLLATAVLHAKCAVRRARAAPKRDRRVRGDHELTRNICDAHSTAALLVGFLAYPTAVSAIFRLLRPCDHYKGGSRRVADDYQTRCGTPAHDAAKAYAWLMVFVIVIGFPFVCALLLYLNRRAIDPPARSEAAKRRLRAVDESITSIAFLFRDYRTDRMYSEPVILILRGFFVGGLALCGKGAARALVGSAAALCVVFLVRELRPYTNRWTNVFAHVASLVVFIVFVGGFLDVSQAIGFNRNGLGIGLLVLCVILAAFFAVLGLREGQRAKVQVLRLREMEFREIETDLDTLQLRADVDQLRRRAGLELESERQVLAAQPPPLLKQQSTLCTSPTRSRSASITSSTGAVKGAAPPLAFFPFDRCCREEADGFQHSADVALRFDKCRYPCYVVSLSRLRSMSRLVCHEAALELGLLEILTPESSAPTSACTYFVSQNWETFGDEPHPDNKRNTKLNWLKHLRRHLRIPRGVEEVWIWWDYISVPQKNRELQAKAISSVVAYAQLASRFLPLVRDADAWEELYDEDLGVLPAGALGTYAVRGWCRLEVVAGLAPKKFSDGSWRPGPRAIRFRYHHNPDDAGVGPLLTNTSIRDPREGRFTVDADRELIEPVLEAVANRYAEYASSGSDAWDATLDVHNRPVWLKEAAGVDPDVAECPSATAAGGRVAVVRPIRPSPQRRGGLGESRSLSSPDLFRSLAMLGAFNGQEGDGVDPTSPFE